VLLIKTSAFCWNNNCVNGIIFETRAECCLAGRGRVVLGDNTGCVLRPIMFRCAGGEIAAGLPYMDVSYSMCTHFQLAPHLAEHNYCLSRGVSNWVVTHVEMYKFNTDEFIMWVCWWWSSSPSPSRRRRRRPPPPPPPPPPVIVVVNSSSSSSSSSSSKVKQSHFRPRSTL
jgi:hypothetical protein